MAAWADVEVGGNTEHKIHYGVSVDSGATFGDRGVPPNPVTDVFWYWRADPRLAVDASTGAIYLVGQVLSFPRLALGLVKGTFSGSTLVWGTPLIIREVTSSLVHGSLAFDASGGSLHLLFSNSASGAIEYQRSTDGNGAVWSAPVALSSVFDQGSVAFPRLVAGLNNDLHAAWAAGVGVASEPIRYRSSTDLGLNWASEQTPATMRMNPVLPGAIDLTTNAKHRTGFSMAVNRVAGSNPLGRVAFAWGETWDFADETFPALTGTFLRNELEPDDDAVGAVAFTNGDALVGALSSSSDADFWKVTLAAGAPLLLWGDSTATVTLRIAIIETDGSAFIASGFSGPGNTAFAFRAPTAGTYFVRVASAIGVPAGNYYRVRTRIGSPLAGEARDLRDVTVAFSGPSGWSSPAHFTFDPVGYDDYMPTIGFGADGLDYVTWYNMSRAPGFTHRSQLVVARNLCGADPVVSPAVTVTTAATNWGALAYFLPPGMGTSNDVSADSRRVFLAWADGRNSNPDAFAATIASTAAITSCPGDTAVLAGTTATPRIGLLNRNTQFDEKAFIQVSGARAWPGALVVRDSVPPGATGPLIVPIPVPDTAAVGVYPLTMTVRRQSGITLGTCNVSLTIQSPVGAGNLEARPFVTAQVGPNPAHGPTRIAFALPLAAEVRIAVYGIQGNLVRTLMSEVRPAGSQALTWDGLDDRGRPVATGLYLVRVEALGRVATRSAVILR